MVIYVFDFPVLITGNLEELNAIENIIGPINPEMQTKTAQQNTEWYDTKP